MRFDRLRASAALPLLAAFGLTFLPAHSAMVSVALHVAICGELRTIDVPIPGKAPSDGRREPCNIACHATGMGDRRRSLNPRCS